ncbi:MAG: hypothetical protein PVG39_04725 [Desulfobacteraceae bacterium]|jgi:hypothetical protein
MTEEKEYKHHDPMSKSEIFDKVERNEHRIRCIKALVCPDCGYDLVKESISWRDTRRTIFWCENCETDHGFVDVVHKM